MVLQKVRYVLSVSAHLTTLTPVLQTDPLSAQYSLKGMLTNNGIMPMTPVKKPIPRERMRADPTNACGRIRLSAPRTG